MMLERADRTYQPEPFFLPDDSQPGLQEACRQLMAVACERHGPSIHVNPSFGKAVVLSEIDLLKLEWCCGVPEAVADLLDEIKGRKPSARRRVRMLKPGGYKRTR
jgi:hypothetical protein